MRWLKLVAKLLGGLVAVGALALGIAAVVYRDHPAAEVEARWATPPSRFVVIDGVRLHYRDEGSGPPVVLLHANYASLFMWEPWAAALKEVGATGFAAVVVFLSILVVGFIYEWKKGALDWE